MDKVIVDPALGMRLHRLRAPVELCDESGRTLGDFTPTEPVEPWMYEWAKAQITDEELEQQRQESGGRTTAEVLQRLNER